jgi:hypothetical protein
MKTFLIHVSMSLIVLALAVELSAFAQQPPQNLLPGIGRLLQSSGASNWSGLSILENIPGTSLYPVTSATTVLYIGFVAGTQVDIGNYRQYGPIHNRAGEHYDYCRNPGDIKGSV